MRDMKIVKGHFTFEERLIRLIGFISP